MEIRSALPNSSTGLKIRPAEKCKWDAVSLGEVLLRFDPGEERITGARTFRVWEGGGEYNVVRGLRRCFGLRTSIVTALVDNPIGRLVEDLMLQGGVDLSHVRWLEFDGIGTAARNGIYFLERGSGVRRGLGVMDRGHSAISQMKPGEVDWDKLFGEEGVRWFHTGGIVAALSPNATEVVREAMTAARRHGTVVSFDCNYRRSLWESRGGRAGAIAVNRSLAPLVDVFFGHEGDLASVVGESSLAPVWHTLESFSAMTAKLSVEFPNLKVIATSTRQVHSASSNGWGAYGYAERTAVKGMQFERVEIFDRVGGGDSFASGVIFGLLSGKNLGWSLDCGVAHGALTMTTAGDSSRVVLAEVEQLMAGAPPATIR